jgi:hypothetical protein
MSVNLVTARDLGDQLLTIATSTSHRTQLLRAHTALGCTTLELGEFTTARQHFEQGLAFHDPERDIRLMTALGADPGIMLLAYLGWAMAALGYPDQGFAAARRAFALGEAHPRSFSMAWALQAIASWHFLCGAMAKALETAEALIALCREQGFTQMLVNGMIWHAAALSWLDQQQGKCDAALKLLEPIYTWFTEGFDFPVLREARVLLDELSKRARPDQGAGQIR